MRKIQSLPSPVPAESFVCDLKNGNFLHTIVTMCRMPRSMRLIRLLTNILYLKRSFVAFKRFPDANGLTQRKKWGQFGRCCCSSRERLRPRTGPQTCHATSVRLCCPCLYALCWFNCGHKSPISRLSRIPTRTLCRPGCWDRRQTL